MIYSASVIKLTRFLRDHTFLTYTPSATIVISSESALIRRVLNHQVSGKVRKYLLE